jgi:hypothetical protein
MQSVREGQAGIFFWKKCRPPWQFRRRGTIFVQKRLAMNFRTFLPLLLAALCVAPACGPAPRQEAPLALAAAYEPPQPPPSPAQAPAAPDTLTFIGVGDIMDGTNYPSAAYLPPDNGRGLWKPVSALLGSADLTFGNLEGTLLNSGGSPKACSNPQRCYVFRMPESHADNFVEAGFDMMSVANNHSGDMGAAGRSSTVRVLQEKGIHAAGLLTNPSATFEYQGLRIGFLAFAPNTGTLDLRDLAGARRRVAALDSVCDLVIVSFHGGAEGPDHQHVPKRVESFVGENRGDVHAFAHAVVEAGADIVWGHGPHVARAVELHQDRFIAYSLGNFCTYARFSLSGVSGLAPLIEIRTDRQGRFLGGQIHSFRQPGEGGPVADPSRQAALKIRELTRADFPSTPLEISEEGQLIRK